MYQLKIQCKAYAISLMYVLLVSCSSGEIDKLSPEQEMQTSNEKQVTEEMIRLIKEVSKQRHPEAHVKRFNQVKTQACFNADFSIVDNLPQELRHGLFAMPGHYDAIIRFANASKADDREKDIRGMSIKVIGIKGKSLWGENGTQDFILNSHPALFAATPEDFLAFIKAMHADRVWWYFFNPLDLHLDSLLLLYKARKVIANPFLIDYWSTTPYRLGDNESVAVKYSIKSCSQHTSQMPASPDEDFLRVTMAEHLHEEAACFNFMVQFQSDPKTMPVEDASVVWDESESEFLKVATITINEQAFNSRQAHFNCENMTFNPWQSLPAHKPLGGINRARKQVYEEIGAYRMAVNK